MSTDIHPHVTEKRAATRQKLAPKVHAIAIKRTYEPVTRRDGKRFLVERLWPRGMKKDSLAMDAWLKDVAPTTQLRQWFGHRPERWEEFRRRYQRQLSASPDAWSPIVEASKQGPVTLLYSARDVNRNGAVVLRDYLLRKHRRHIVSHARHALKRHPLEKGAKDREVH